MAKVGPLHINDSILDAIRDQKLVIFAGAGVSMGSPADLPSFYKLAQSISNGTGTNLEKKEPIDKFLGRLKHENIDVHQLASKHLLKPDSAPTELHINLLKLFRGQEAVRIVTTNFDLHFESAAQIVYEQPINVFRAPALPLGRNFSGLVHIHGALTHPSEMVLTDSDFGRGYLTEGWARRFLLDVFRTYTVLFVGYSHDDVVMNYLARALPTEGYAGRFALTETEGNWSLLGISPILFKKGRRGKNQYRELYEGLRLLSARARRGVIDWKTQLGLIGNGPPPIEEEQIDEVEHALKDLSTTRFLLDAASHPEWPKWLNTRKKIESLFDHNSLDEREKLLSNWMAEKFAVTYPDILFGIIASHNMNINQIFWFNLCQVISEESNSISDKHLARWVSVLLACAPRNLDGDALGWLAKRCFLQSNIALVTEIYLFMASCQLKIKPAFDWSEADKEIKEIRFDVETSSHIDHFNINEIWTNYLKLNLDAVSRYLLSGVVRHLEEYYETLRNWDKAGGDWDLQSYRRSAIEAHDQDQFPEAIDVIIDSARDSLTSLAGYNYGLMLAWVEQLVLSKVPLIRRIALNAHTEHCKASPDIKLKWILKHFDLFSLNEYHEIYSALKAVYPLSSKVTRQKVIKIITSHKQPDYENRTAEERTARAHFDWLSWLNLSDPKCVLVQEKLDPIFKAYPEWRLSKRPDLLHWHSSVFSGPRSPLTVEELLAVPALSRIDELMSFKGDWFDGPDRGGLLSAIQEACKQNISWAFELIEYLKSNSLWDSDIWPSILRGLRDNNLNPEDWETLLLTLESEVLFDSNANEIAGLIYGLVKDGGKPFSLDLLDHANSVALKLWLSLPKESEDGETRDWLSTAINRPAGVIVEFWINGLSLLSKTTAQEDRNLPQYYLERFIDVINENSKIGGLGRSVLASQIAFIYSLDKNWTIEHVVPLFSSNDDLKFMQAWDGFLVWGRLNDKLVESMMPTFQPALPRLISANKDRRQRFLEFYTAIAVFHVDDPRPTFLATLFRLAVADDLTYFSQFIGMYLRQMSSSVRQDLWSRWLKDYWEARLNSIPKNLIESESRNMLDWVLYLEEQFVEAVELAIRLPINKIQHSQLLHGLEKSDLVTKFPDATAELLTYICPRIQGYMRSYIVRIEQRLTTLKPKIRLNLDEAMAAAGIDKL